MDKNRITNYCMLMDVYSWNKEFYCLLFTVLLFTVLYCVCQSPKSDWLVVGAQLCIMPMHRFGVYVFCSLCQSPKVTGWKIEVIVSSPVHLHPDLLFQNMKNYT
jgi:hypothetical protein